MTTTDPTSLLHFDNLELDIEIRVLIKDDQPYFAAKDVCMSLGLEQTSRATDGLDTDELVLLKVTSGGQKRDLQFVTESGLYALVFKSRKEAAKKFRKWVTSEVLPAIRRHGRYDALALAGEMPPEARAGFLFAEASQLQARAGLLRHRAELAQALPDQMTVGQWLLEQGRDASKGCGFLAVACKRLADARGIPTGKVREVIKAGHRRRLCRSAMTFPQEIIAQVCGPATA